MRRPNSTNSTPMSGTKNATYVVTEVDRATRCIVSWAALWERTWEAMQRVIEGADPAQRYYSNGFATYETLVYYPGTHAVAVGQEPDVQHGGRQG